jgi:hypothetical protein
MFASRIWNCLGKNYKNGTGQIWKTGRHLTHPFWTLNPSALNFPLPGSSSRRALLPPALSPPLPPPSSTAAGCSFTAWRRHHRRGNPHCAARACWEFRFPSLSVSPLSWSSYFLSWRRRLGERRRNSVFAGPFAGDEHTSGMPSPSLPFLLCEAEDPKPNISYLYSDLTQLQYITY